MPLLTGSNVPSKTMANTFTSLQFRKYVYLAARDKIMAKIPESNVNTLNGVTSTYRRLKLCVPCFPRSRVTVCNLPDFARGLAAALALALGLRAVSATPPAPPVATIFTNIPIMDKGYAVIGRDDGLSLLMGTNCCFFFGDTVLSQPNYLGSSWVVNTMYHTGNTNGNLGVSGGYNFKTTGVPPAIWASAAATILRPPGFPPFSSSPTPRMKPTGMPPTPATTPLASGLTASFTARPMATSTSRSERSSKPPRSLASASDWSSVPPIRLEQTRPESSAVRATRSRTSCGTRARASGETCAPR
ncbi:hypothetical protein SBV1_1760018 [Verrucomicrobia bacterium]|nr:hypothetical protein SBV1_1760018 [Verrucomicrobiota bacterium]